MADVILRPGDGNSTRTVILMAIPTEPPPVSANDVILTIAYDTAGTILLLSSDDSSRVEFLRDEPHMWAFC